MKRCRQCFGLHILLCEVFDLLHLLLQIPECLLLLDGIHLPAFGSIFLEFLHLLLEFLNHLVEGLRLAFFEFLGPLAHLLKVLAKALSSRLSIQQFLHRIAVPNVPPLSSDSFLFFGQRLLIGLFLILLHLLERSNELFQRLLDFL